MKPLPKSYDHKETEKRWQEGWYRSAVYEWNEDSKREDNFVIDTPPPTVSGVLHMGHIFSYTQADFVARYQRMKGKNVFYPMGFDDNGLPTERLVEKVKKIRASDMKREEFIEICKEVVKEAEEEFRRLFKSVALSVDWKQEYQTISANSRKISQMSFLDLFNKGYAYRKLQPMLWDPADQTAIAQAEVEDKEHESFMNQIPFGVEGSDDKVVIATTRPELLAACVAVFYHPDDERYQHLAGKTAITALFGAKVPFLADDKVQMDKGTGLVMCCTYGDETDIAWWKEHNLPVRLILNKYGKIDHVDGIGSKHDLTGEDWPVVDIEKAKEFVSQIKGLKAKIARDKIVEILEEQGLIIKRDPITHAVKCAERSGHVLEILPTNQWFIKILDKKEELRAKVEKCNWHPEFMKVRALQWIDGLNWDWCISRQRYFGVPFPVWYSKRAGEEGKILLPELEQLPVDPMVSLPKGYSKDEVEPELDVMDTWATSSVSPQLSSSAINKDYAIDYDRHQKLFPADLRPQAHEIIRTWAFYTIVKAHLHEDEIPWKDLMISGWCLASDKTKMSKSKGNVVTPVDLIEERGADVVRFWASTSKLGADTAFSEDVLKIGKKLVNKLWNATKFAAIHLEKLTAEPESASGDVESGVIYEPLDLWVLTRLKKAVSRATAEFEKFEYSNARAAIEDFFWNDFCDNYLELVKTRVYGEDESISDKARQSAVNTIYHCLDGILRLFAPFVPHVTDELYSHIFEKRHAAFGGSIHNVGTWPNEADYPNCADEEKAGIAAVAILNVVRKMKAERNVSVKWPLDNLLIEAKTNDNAVLKGVEALAGDLKNVTNASKVDFGKVSDEGHFTTEDGGFAVWASFSSGE